MMKKLGLAILALATASVTTIAAPKKPGFKITNPSPYGRKQQCVVVAKQQLQRFIGTWNPNLFPVLSVGGKVIASQVDDIDRNGHWDELAFQLDLAGNESATITVKWVPFAQLPKFPQKTQAVLRVAEKRDDQYETVKFDTRPQDWKPQQQPSRYQMEGPGWENDVVAFRSYFDARNGKDIFGKVRPELIIDKIGIAKTPLGNYHKLEGWGMDILKVGESLGAGALALQEGDSLYPIGQSKNLTYQLVSEGPVRSILRLTNTAWAVPGEQVNSTETISIWAGKYWYENTVVLTGFKAPKTLITGVTYVHHPAPFAFYAEKSSKLPWVATHALQSENNDILGMAAIFQSQGFEGYGDARKDTKRVKTTYYGKLKVLPSMPVKYRFLAGWQLSQQQFADPDRWKKFVQDEADDMANPFLLSAMD